MDEGLATPRMHLPPGEDFLLLPPTQQAHAYRNVDRLFATRPIRRGPSVLDLPRGREILPRWQGPGGARDLEFHLGAGNIAGLLVLHRGQIRLERYGLGLTEEGRWSTMSMVKSLTSTLVGVALRDGAIGSLDDRVSAHLPALRGSAYDGVAVRHLLTMSSGVAWSEDYTDRQSDVNRYSASLGARRAGGVLALMRGLSAAHPPGRRFNYNSGDTYVLGCLLSAATGQPLADHMSQAVWARLGMEFEGFYTLESEGGQEIGGSRAGMALRDLGRFGLFMLSGGVAGGARLLPEDWLAEAARPAFALDPAANSYGATGYGYSWWLDGEGAMVAVGFAGQTLYLHPAEDLVIVTLSCQPQPPHAVPGGFDFKAERRAFHAAVARALRAG